MLHFLPAPLLGGITLLGLVLNTCFWMIPFFAVTLVKLLIPLPPVRRRLSQILARIAEGWISVNNIVFILGPRIKWEISGLEGLSRQQWYLICSNHLSLVDIPLLQRVFYKRIPFIRFFIKQELFWVPVLGLAWWALDFPFMKRYSQAYLARHPEKRGHDLVTTRKACARFRDMPTTILNFAEGTRYTSAKHKAQASPHRHLLRPKAGGMATVLAAMGDMFAAILNVTIVYPDGPIGLWDLLSGRISRVIVHVEQIAIPRELIGGDYANDPAFRTRFQEWVQQLWHEKDELIERLNPGAVSVSSD